MSTVSHVLEQCKSHLYGTQRALLNRLKTATDTLTTTIVCEFPVDASPRGSYVSIGGELMYVWLQNLGDRSLTVQRAQRGTTAATHAIGELMEINPRFPTDLVLHAIEAEIRSWEPKLFRVATETVSVASSSRHADLQTAGEIFAVIDAQRTPKVGSDVWLPTIVRYDSHATPPAIYLSNGAFGGGDIRLALAVPFALESFDEGTDLATVGVTPDMEDIIPYGVAWRLLSSREVLRTATDAQGESRAAEEVPAMHISQAAQALKRLRDARIAEAQNRLRTINPRTGG